MSEHGSYFATKSRFSSARDIPHRQPDELSSTSSRWKKEKKIPYTFANVLAPLPPSPPRPVNNNTNANLLNHQITPPSSLARSYTLPSRVSQAPSTPPSRRMSASHHRGYSAPQHPPLAPHPPSSHRVDYDHPSSPFHGSNSYSANSRPGSSSGFGAAAAFDASSRTNLSRRSRRSSKSSPMHPPPTMMMMPHTSPAIMGTQLPAMHHRPTVWPPPGYNPRTVLSGSEALQLVARGALEFRGKVVSVHGAAEAGAAEASRYYSTTVMDNHPVFCETSTQEDPELRAVSLSFMGEAEGNEAWGSLEYPSMLYAFGRYPGTTTINWHVGMKGSVRNPVDFAESKGRKKRMKLHSILERLMTLEENGWNLEDDEETQYDFLYNRLIEDPERSTNPHYDRALQIIDLYNVLMSRDWIDFSLPKYQIVARYWDSSDEKVKTKFFHQLLLAVELHLRIQHRDHLPENKRSVLRSLPPKVAWDLALAQRWIDNVSIEHEAISSQDSDFHFQFPNKENQRAALKHFARLLKWPNPEEVEYALEEDDRRSSAIEEKTSDTMCWFTGVILPGPTLPFILMNSLIDCDEDTSSSLHTLTHVNPSCGFQYRANTYWSYKCVLGKVLGASRGVKQVSGWIGPCQFSPDLGRAQCIIIEAEKPAQLHLSVESEDIKDMQDRSDVLGPVDLEDYQIQDFDIPSLPDTYDIDETAIRIQKLSFFQANSPTSPSKSDSSSRSKKGTKPHEAAVVFAVSGSNLPIRLRYDVDFISLPPCDNGPHPLFRDYTTHFVRVDNSLKNMAGLDGEFHVEPERAARELERHLDGTHGISHRREIDAAGIYYSQDWASGHFQRPPSAIRGALPTSSRDYDSDVSSTTSRNTRHENGQDANSQDEDEPTTVIDASGVSDNEVFARAWCAHWGEHAIIINIKETCVACAVRAAKSVKIRVVIVSEGGIETERDTGVCDLVSVMG